MAPSPTEGYCRPVRSRYVDLLRAAAIARVLLYHSFGRAWLTIIFPSMGVMFALAGSLMAASMESRGARYAVGSRVRRLLPPLWAFGLVAVPVMLLAGWSPYDPDHPLNWLRLAFWIVPIGDPRGSEWGYPFWVVLWYLRAYLWLVLLTPLIYLLYRRRWWLAIAAPLVLLAGLILSGAKAPETMHGGIWDIAIYGPCWIVGFAHHDGRLAAVRLPVLFTIAGVSAAGGMTWMLTHTLPPDGDLNDIPVAEALWALAFVLLVLRWRPNLDWLDRVRPLAAVVRFINARAVTIYLWHNVMISVAGALITFVALNHVGLWTEPAVFLVDIALTLLVTLAVGWVEDIAARRRPALLPVPGKKLEAIAETG
jgi:peptidoglycan/LPS O-acetylase OafA/YrhL